MSAPDAVREAQSLASLGADPEEGELVSHLRDELTRYLAAEVDPLRIDAEHTIPPHILQDLAGMGLFGLAIPEEYGGAGMSLKAVCETVAHMARTDRSVATTVGLHGGLGTRGLVRYGSKALQERYLPPMAAGETIGAFAATEPNAGSALTHLQTTAVADPAGLRVDGSKVYVTNGGFAGVYTILTATPGMGGGRFSQSLLLLERGDAGLSVGPEEGKLGLRGSSTTPVYLDAVKVPGDRVVGALGQGAEAIEHILAWGRTVMAAGTVGSAKSAFDMAVRHVCVRKQFGRPLSNLEVVRGQVASMSSSLFAMQALSGRAALAPDDLTLAVRSLSAKVFCSEESGRVCDVSLQLHGGAGYIEETGVALLVRDGRVTRIFEGANDVLLTRLGAAALARPDDAPPEVGEGLRPALDALRDSVHGLRTHLLETYGGRLGRRHADLHRLGTAWVLLEASEAAALRAHGEGTELARARAAGWLETARHRFAGLGPPDREAAESIANAHYERLAP